LVLFPVL